MWVVTTFSGEVKSECVDANQEWSPFSNYAKRKSVELMFPPGVHADWERVRIAFPAALHEEAERHAVKSPLAQWAPLPAWHLAGYADTLDQFPEAVKQQRYVPVLASNCPGAARLAQVPLANQTVLKMQPIDLSAGLVLCPNYISWN